MFCFAFVVLGKNNRDMSTDVLRMNGEQVGNSIYAITIRNKDMVAGGFVYRKTIVAWSTFYSIDEHRLDPPGVFSCALRKWVF